MTRLFLVAAFSVLISVPATAQMRSDQAKLYLALGLSDVIEVMRDEGVEYGLELQHEMFPGRGGAAWSRTVEEIYDAERMELVVEDRFGQMLDDVDLEPLLKFFISPDGAQIIELELEARRAMMDDAVEAAAEENFARMQAEDARRLAMVERFVEANDLVEANVVGAMNSNFAFYSGLMDAEAGGLEMTEEEVLSDVWSQEPEIRADTLNWVYSYLLLAYQPLSDEVLRAYTELSETEEGQALNRALFGAFDAMYVDISRRLGRQAAVFMAGQDI